MKPQLKQKTSENTTQKKTPDTKNPSTSDWAGRGAAAAIGGAAALKGGYELTRGFGNLKRDDSSDEGVSESVIEKLKGLSNRPNLNIIDRGQSGFTMSKMLGDRESTIRESVDHAINSTPLLSDIHRPEIEKEVGKEFDQLLENDTIFKRPTAPLQEVAHEFGHAQKPGNALTQKMRDVYFSDKYLGNKKPVSIGGMSMPGFTKVPAAATLGGVGMAALGGKKTRSLGAALPLLAASPYLVEEARASMNADKYMRDMGVEGKDLWDARKDLLRAYGTYAALPAAGAATAYIIKKYRDAMEKKQEDVDPEERGGLIHKGRARETLTRRHTPGLAKKRKIATPLMGALVGGTIGLSHNDVLGGSAGTNAAIGAGIGGVGFGALQKMMDKRIGGYKNLSDEELKQMAELDDNQFNRIKNNKLEWYKK